MGVYSEELNTTISAVQKKLVWVRYLYGAEPEGMILHNIKKMRFENFLFLFYFSYVRHWESNAFFFSKVAEI